MKDEHPFSLPGYPKKLRIKKKQEPSFEVSLLVVMFAYLWALLTLLSAFPLNGIIAVTVMSFFLYLPRFASRVVVKRFTFVIGALAVSGFVGTMISTVQLGGIALNGQVLGEHYYVGDHGHYFLVTYNAYLASLVVCCITVCLWPCLFCIPLVNHLVKRQERDRLRRQAGR